MAPIFTVRGFEEGDRAAVRRIFRRSRRLAFPWIPAHELRLDDYDAATQGETVWVAVSDAAILGFAAVWVPDRFLHSLFVDPDHVRQGVGSALLDACLRAIERPVSLKCVKRNRTAIAFYERRGWEIEGEGVAPEGEYFLMRLWK